MNNREIKFRVFALGKKEMLYPENKMSFNIDFVQEKVLVCWDQNTFIGGGFENMKIMQFTGFKDKTGKEIYEGDIITFFRHGQLRKEAIEFRNYAFTVGLSLNFYLHELYNFFYDLEVIGNIHENPELLNG